ncbi:MAG: hypothetical protein HYU36_07845 [Planctomycetes bacterium]|nr:hypothetical protein [Planctomycetota bacterium]
MKRKTDKGFTNSIMGAKDKLAGGVKNILGAPMEMAVSVDQGYQRRRRAGALSGFVEGFSRFARRLGSGVVDVVTFPTRFPNNSYRNGMPPKGPVKMYRDHRKQRSFSTRGS